MIWRRFRQTFATGLVLSALSACNQPHPISPGTDKAYYGHLLEGEKFGVSIGISQDEAVRILTERGFRDAGLIGCASYPRQLSACDSQDTHRAILRKDFLKDGLIFLRIEDEKVASIFWSFVVVSLVI